MKVFYLHIFQLVILSTSVPRILSEHSDMKHELIIYLEKLNM